MTQPLGGVVDLRPLQLDPLPVGGDQGLQPGAKLGLRGLVQELHVQDEPVQPGEGGVPVGVLDGRRGGPGDLVAGDRPGRDPDGPVGVRRVQVGVGGRPVPHGELDVPTIDHRQHVGLLLVGFVGAGQVDAAEPLVEDGGAVGGLDRQFALEHPGAFPVGGRRLGPVVDQEQRDAPVVGAAADQSLDLGVGERLVGEDGTDRTRLERDLVGGAAGLAFPDPLGRPGLGVGQEGAGRLVVASPAGRDLEGRDIERDAEGEAQRRGEHGLGHRGRPFGRAVVAPEVAPPGPFDRHLVAGREVAFEDVVVLGGRGGGRVELGRGHVLGTLAGGQDADEVAVPDASGDLFLVPLDGATEFPDRHLLQHVPQFEG